MEKQYEVVNRYLDIVKNDWKYTGTKGVIEKIKLTEQSKNKIDAVYDDFRKSIYNVNVNSDIAQNEVKEDSATEKSIESDDFEFELVSPNCEQIEKSTFRPSSRAIKLTDVMVNNTVKKYTESVPKVDVNDVNTDEIANTVVENFDFYNINQQPDTSENDNFYKEDDKQNENDSIDIQEESTLDNLVNSYENESINEDEQSILDSSNSEIEKNIVPEIKDYFQNNNFEGIISDNVVSNDEEEVYAEQSNDDLFNQVSSSIENENTTIEELDKLREALQMERERRARLTQELEEKQMAAAVAEKEEQEAEREKQAKIVEYNEELNALRNENAGLQEQTKIIEEKTQETNSNVVNMRNYVSALNEIMMDVSSQNSFGDISVEKGRKVA